MSGDQDREELVDALVALDDPTRQGMRISVAYEVADHILTSDWLREQRARAWAEGMIATCTQFAALTGWAAQENPQREDEPPMPANPYGTTRLSTAWSDGMDWITRRGLLENALDWARYEGETDGDDDD